MERDRSSLGSNETPFYKRRGIRRLLLGILAIAFLWAAFGGSEGDDGEDVDESSFADYPAGYYDSDESSAGYDFESGGTGGFEDEYAPELGGAGWQEEGAYRGEAEVGGSPIVSGTVDESGGGNSVHSIDGMVLELP